ncbi:hypothetical protein D9M71_253120 [compost metagenome]
MPLRVAVLRLNDGAADILRQPGDILVVRCDPGDGHALLLQRGEGIQRNPGLSRRIHAGRCETQGPSSLGACDQHFERRELLVKLREIAVLLRGQAVRHQDDVDRHFRCLGGLMRQVQRLSQSRTGQGRLRHDVGFQWLQEKLEEAVVPRERYHQVGRFRIGDHAERRLGHQLAQGLDLVPGRPVAVGCDVARVHGVAIAEQDDHRCLVFQFIRQLLVPGRAGQGQHAEEQHRPQQLDGTE